MDGPVQFLIKQRGLTSGVVGVLVVLLCVGVLGGTSSPVGVITAVILGPLAYLGTNLYIRAYGTGALLGDDRRQALDDCVAMAGRIEGAARDLPSRAAARNDIEGLASISQAVLASMRADPDKLDDVVNFELSYLQPIAQAVQTYSLLANEQIPGQKGDAVRTRLESVFPKALARLKQYQETLYSGDVQQIEGLTDMLEKDFSDDETVAEPSGR